MKILFASIAILAIALPDLSAGKLTIEPQASRISANGKDIVVFKVQRDGEDVANLHLSAEPPDIAATPIFNLDPSKLILTAPKGLPKGVALVEVVVTATDQGNNESVSAIVQIVREAIAVIPDERDGFEASFYTGLAIDSFSAGEFRRYINPEAADRQPERMIGGFDFSYRLFGDPNKQRQPQLWIYGETVHGVRSTEVDCSGQNPPPVCPSNGPLDPTGSGERVLWILRNATSLEAFAGLRLEFLELPLPFHTDHPARLYVKGQMGFLGVTKSGEDVIDVHHVGVGVTATGGRYMGSYFEVAYGRSDLFTFHRSRRFKIDGYLEWQPQGSVLGYLRRKLGMSPFVQMTVDADAGRGADSIHTYLGLSFDLDDLFGGI